MRLFRANPGGTRRDRLGRAYTAWAYYNWETLVGFSFMFAPLLSDPPEWPLPDATTEPECMYYYHLILTLFKPLLDIPTEKIPSPHQIVTDATRYLQTLVRIYYLRHGYEAMDLFIVIPLMLLASDCVDALDAANSQTPSDQLESLRSTLILVTMGLVTQRKNHYLANALFHVIRGRMRPADVALFRTAGNIDANVLNGKPDMAVAVRSHWPVSIVKKEEKEKQVLKNLVDSYAHLSIENGNS
ncbi:hypothetical protein E8E13_006029 [Curvularia kusanoi]|uniref:Uncharacterized protein n=1 Tax=Curvularia kusanoi TaxID=90978 RepID=A0A9P4TE11_CURKU|nr:hypothetical protein E8E13_006029 [Curvularia kusanoi]